MFPCRLTFPPVRSLNTHRHTTQDTQGNPLTNRLSIWWLEQETQTFVDSIRALSDKPGTRERSLMVNLLLRTHSSGPHDSCYTAAHYWIHSCSRIWFSLKLLFCSLTMTVDFWGCFCFWLRRFVYWLFLFLLTFQRYLIALNLQPEEPALVETDLTKSRWADVACLTQSLVQILKKGLK